eukprot:3805666-Rhodomonas_salina.3
MLTPVLNWPYAACISLLTPVLTRACVIIQRPVLTRLLCHTEAGTEAGVWRYQGNALLGKEGEGFKVLR